MTANAHSYFDSKIKYISCVVPPVFAPPVSLLLIDAGPSILPPAHSERVCYRHGAELVHCSIGQLQAVRASFAADALAAVPPAAPFARNAEDVLVCHAELLSALATPTVAKGLLAIRKLSDKRCPSHIERAARSLDVASSLL